MDQSSSSCVYTVVFNLENVIYSQITLSVWKAAIFNDKYKISFIPLVEDKTIRINWPL